jgi:hypothetical protein
MSKSGPLRTEQVGYSLTFMALACNLTPASHRMFNPAAPEALLCWSCTGPLQTGREMFCGALCLSRKRSSDKRIDAMVLDWRRVLSTRLFLQIDSPFFAKGPEISDDMPEYSLIVCAFTPLRGQDGRCAR